MLQLDRFRTEAKLLGLLTLSVVCLPLACASAQVPTQSVADARSSAAAAQAVGAERDPQAALHLKMANTTIARAERLIADDEMDDAKDALAEAKIDADLALKLATVAESKRKIAEAQTQLQDLTEEVRGVAQ